MNAIMQAGGTIQGNILSLDASLISHGRQSWYALMQSELFNDGSKFLAFKPVHV
jgi:hypothetical protein